MDHLDKSIEEIENDYWKDQQHYVSRLARECHELRKIKVRDLEIHQIITLLIQDIGSEILMPLVLNRMSENIIQEDPFDGSSFIQSVDFFDHKIWKRNPTLHDMTMDTIKKNQSKIESRWGFKIYERTIRKMQDKNKISK